MDIQFFISTFFLAIGLAMDAFSVSIADGFNETKMPLKKCLAISTTFAIFQGLMPLIGWVLVHTVLEQLAIFEHFIPWIALILLLFIGIKMIVEHFKKQKETTLKETKKQSIGFKLILLQAVATSIDALSVGFTIAEYTFVFALVAVLIIAVITFVICLVGVILGKKFGTSFSKFAELIGGIILVFIGCEIFITGMISFYA